MRFRSVAVAGALVLSVASCDAGAPVQKKVYGFRDDVKHKPAVKEVSHQEKKTKQECSLRIKGSCKSWRTVPDGTKKVVDKKAKPALYCVELDDVNGSAKDDDVWYTVTARTYFKAVAKEPGNKIKFRPIHGGCW